MFNWIDDFFNNVACDLETIFQNMSDMSTELSELVENLNDYIQFSTYYIYASGAMLVILFFMFCASMSKQKKQDAALEEIKQLLNDRLPALEVLEEEPEANDADPEEDAMNIIS